MDQFDLAKERYAKKYGGNVLTPEGPVVMATPKVTASVIPQERPRPPFNRLTIGISNGPETWIMDFDAPDFLENMMHSDRTELGVKLKLMQILRDNLTTGIR